MNGFEIGVFGLIGIAIVALIVLFLMNKGIRKWRERAEENYIIQQKRKEQKEKNPFGDDYFKSSDPPKKQHKPKEAKSDFKAQREPKDFKKAEEPKAKASQQQETTAHKTTTSSGVTIIDDRAEDKKKIFEGDGEYVEFEEV